MWDNLFTASLAGYAVSVVIFLIGRYLLTSLPAAELVGAVLLGLTGLAIGISGLGMLLTVAFKPKAQP